MWVNVTVTSAEDGSFGIGMIEDISARRRLEQERKQLLARTVEVAEAERMALAADLHDGPIQHLTAVTLTLDLLANKLTRGETAGATALAHRLRESIAAEMHSLRRLMTELRPPILDERGLEAALRDCADAALDGADVGFTLESNLDGYRLAPEIETSIYRVVREALTNVRKHAGRATRRWLWTWARGAIVLSVADDGVGFSGNGSRGHYGLLTMRERVESMDGTWRLDTAPGKGTTIRAVLSRGSCAACDAIRTAALGERVHFALGEREVARGDVVRALRLERRLDLAADLLRLPAARVEAARRRRVRPGSARRRRGRRWRSTLGRSGPAAGTADSSAPVYGWRGCGVEAIAGRELDDLAEIHDGDAVAHVADDRRGRAR